MIKTNLNHNSSRYSRYRFSVDTDRYKQIQIGTNRYRQIQIDTVDTDIDTTEQIQQIQVDTIDTVDTSRYKTIDLYLN